MSAPKESAAGRAPHNADNDAQQQHTDNSKTRLDLKGAGQGPHKDDHSDKQFADEQAARIEFTVLESTKGSLSKSLALDAAGELVKKPASYMSQGTAERRFITDLAQLGPIIAAMNSRTALMTGVLRPDLPERCKVVTKKSLADASAFAVVNSDIIARSKDHFIYETKPTLLLFDSDAGQMPAAVAARVAELGGNWGAIEHANPGLRSAARVMRESTSNGLYRTDTGQRFKGSAGTHSYVGIKDGTDSARALKVAQARCWLDGTGFIMPSARGDMLVRSPVDITVASPERINFEGASELTPPLAQKRPPPIYVPGIGAIDTHVVFPDLTPQEKAEVARLIAEAKRALAAESKRIRAEWTAKRIAAIMAETGCTLEAARKAVKRMIEGGVLAPDFILYPQTGGSVTVRDVLADFERFEGVYFASPAEGPSYGVTQGHLFRRDDGGICLYDHAHGSGAIYQLKHNRTSLESALRACTDEPDGETPDRCYLRLLPHTDLDPVDLDAVRKLTAKRSGVGLNALKATEKAAKQVQQTECAPTERGNEDDGELILQHSAPLESARKFVERDFTQNGVRTLHYQQGVFYGYTGVYYQELSDADMHARAYEFLESAKCINQSGIMVPFNPDRKSIEDFLHALKSAVHLPSGIQAPAWLGDKGEFPASEILACSNTLLHTRTRTTIPHTPKFFTLNAVPFDYDPAAECREWDKFTSEIFPGDQEQVDTLHETFGYILTPDTTFQKAFIWLGPPRSGKGTAARVLEALRGASNICHPTVQSFASEFGLQPFIGKLLAIVHDARDSGRGDKSVIVERILNITGEDSLTINRKNLPHWIGKLQSRALVISNQLLAMPDASGAFVSRFVIQIFRVSFLGREDKGLMDRLLGELPGILNKALDGLDRLTARGHFVQPTSSLDTIAAFTRLTSSVKSFLDDRCLVGPKHKVLCKELYAEYVHWHEAEGGNFTKISENFGKDLRAAVPNLKRMREGAATENGIIPRSLLGRIPPV